MSRTSVAVIGLLLGEVILNAACGRIIRSASTNPSPTVICPKSVLLHTPDSLGRTTFEMSVALPPDGRTVASGRMESSDTVVSLCDVASGRERATIKASSVESCAVAFSSDGRTLAVSRYRGVSLLDPVAGHERAGLGAEYAFDPLGLAFSSDGRRLAAATILGHFIVWDIGTGRSLDSFKAHTRSLQGVSLSPDGQLVASASDGPIVCHADGPFGLLPQIFGVAAVGCGPDYGIVRLFDVPTGEAKASLKHDWTVHSVSFSPDGKVLASGGGGAVKLWDLSSRKARTLLTVESDLEVYCVSFSPDGQTLAVGGGGGGFDRSYGEVKLWDLKMGRIRAVIKGEMRKIRSLAFAPDGKSLVTGSGEVVVQWDPASDFPDSWTGKLHTLGEKMTIDPQHSSVWFQRPWSYLTALLLTLVIFPGPIVLAQKGKPDQERAIAATEATGGKVERDEGAPGRPVVKLVIVLKAGELVRHVEAFPDLRTLIVRFDSLTDANLRHLHGLTRLETLNLAFNKLTDAGMEHLEKLTSLRVLLLGGNAITDAGLTRLKALNKLRVLGLDETKITDAGLVHLRACHELQELALTGCEITDSGLAHLRGLKDLRMLNVAGTQVSDDALEHLRGLANLRTLWLTSTRITDEGLKHLEGLTGLQSLYINNNQITDAGLKHIHGLASLQNLSLARTGVTDEGLGHLEGLKQLGTLYLDGARVSDAGVEKLRRATPRGRDQSMIVAGGKIRGGSPEIRGVRLDDRHLTVIRIPFRRLDEDMQLFTWCGWLRVSWISARVCACLLRVRLPGRSKVRPCSLRSGRRSACLRRPDGQQAPGAWSGPHPPCPRDAGACRRA